MQRAGDDAHSPATMYSLLNNPAEPAYQQTVLLVDPRPDTQSGLAGFLQGLGARLLHAPSGERALEILLGNDIALVLADAALAGMDGYELTQWVRDNSRTRHIPVILLSSGIWDSSAIARAYEAGAIDYLGTPVAEPVLSSKVAVLLELDGNRRKLRQAISNIDTTKAYYESMLNAAGEGVIGLDREGHIRFANPAARAMLEVGTAQLDGADYRLFYPFPTGTCHDGKTRPFSTRCARVSKAVWKKQFSSGMTAQNFRYR
jgi:CheY-like chemotaxis protein